MTEIRYDPAKWTGRATWAGTPADMLKRQVRVWLYPYYDCQQCVGQEEWQGCYCAYYEAVAPNTGPEKWRIVLRKIAQRWLGVSAHD